MVIPHTHTTRLHYLVRFTWLVCVYTHCDYLHHTGPHRFWIPAHYTPAPPPPPFGLDFTTPHHMIRLPYSRSRFTSPRFTYGSFTAHAGLTPHRLHTAHVRFTVHTTFTAVTAPIHWTALHAHFTHHLLPRLGPTVHTGSLPGFTYTRFWVTSFLHLAHTSWFTRFMGSHHHVYTYTTLPFTILFSFTLLRFGSRLRSFTPHTARLRLPQHRTCCTLLTFWFVLHHYWFCVPVCSVGPHHAHYCTLSVLHSSFSFTGFTVLRLVRIYTALVRLRSHLGPHTGFTCTHYLPYIHAPGYTVLDTHYLLVRFSSGLVTCHRVCTFHTVPTATFTGYTLHHLRYTPLHGSRHVLTSAVHVPCTVHTHVLGSGHTFIFSLRLRSVRFLVTTLTTTPRLRFFHVHHTVLHSSFYTHLFYTVGSPVHSPRWSHSSSRLHHVPHTQVLPGLGLRFLVLVHHTTTVCTHVYVLVHGSYVTFGLRSHYGYSLVYTPPHLTLLGSHRLGLQFARHHTTVHTFTTWVLHAHLHCTRTLPPVTFSRYVTFLTTLVHTHTHLLHGLVYTHTHTHLPGFTRSLHTFTFTHAVTTFGLRFSFRCTPLPFAFGSFGWMVYHFHRFTGWVSSHCTHTTHGSVGSFTHGLHSRLVPHSFGSHTARSTLPSPVHHYSFTTFTFSAHTTQVLDHTRSGSLGSWFYTFCHHLGCLHGFTVHVPTSLDYTPG